MRSNQANSKISYLVDMPKSLHYFDANLKQFHLRLNLAHLIGIKLELVTFSNYGCPFGLSLSGFPSTTPL